MFADLRVLWNYLAPPSTPRRSDVLFCFGSFYLGVARRAATLHAQGIAPWVLVTGSTAGRIPPHPTEADAYADVLRTSGVPAHRIVIEREASNTGQNVTLGMQALADHGVDVNTAVLVAWPTSLRRCAATFSRHFPSARTFTEPAFTGFGPYSSVPERAVRTSLAELERLRTYPDLGYIARQEEPPQVTAAAARLAESSTALAPLIS